jgi:UDP-N-acetyl-D-glucosamine dehydrogenase
MNESVSLRKSKDLDISYFIEAVKNIAKILQGVQLYILESTVYPGASVELIAPILEKSSLKVGYDFYQAFSPEGVDSGNKQYGIRDIPKIAGEITSQCTESCIQYYKMVFKGVVLMDSTREAEMEKFLENTFRAFNIVLINEMALIAHNTGINLWNMIDAANTKPFRFILFFPSSNPGCHCIPLDPFYFYWKTKTYQVDTCFIELAGKINSQMQAYIAGRVAYLLNQQGNSLKGSKIQVLIISYKRDVNDTRESSALDIIGLLSKKGALVSFYDPYLPSFSFLKLQWGSGC